MSVDPQLIEALQPLIARVRTDVTAVKGEGGMAWTREPLTKERLAKHLNGGPARGVCPIKEGESVTMVAVLDLDSHQGESAWAEMAEAAGAVTAELQSRGLEPVAFRSRGGRGIHLILLWDEPQDAYSVRVELIDALRTVGYASGDAGVARKQIEVFPKQNSVEVGRFGNQFILPLAGASELLLPDLGFDPVGKDAVIGMDWPISRAVPVREKPTRQQHAVARNAEPGMAERALWAIPNDLDSRDDWFALMCAAKEAGVDKEVCRAWTMQHGSYTDEGFDGPFDSIEIGKPEGTPAEYLYHVAEGCGWTERVLAEFSVKEVQPGDPPEPPAFKRDKKGIEATVTNTVWAMERPDLIGVRLGRDRFRDDVLIGHPTRDDWRPLKDADMVALRMQLERLGFKSAPKELARDAVIKVAADNEFDTAIAWAKLLRWDGVPRVERFLQTYMGCEDTPYVRAVSRYMWSAMAGRALVPGVQADMAPIFQGDQGLRKSSVIRALVPADEFHAEIDFSAKEEDTVRKLRGVLVAEIAELTGLHTRALESIKQFMTRRVEKWIPKYVEFPTTFARRSIFIGTTNEGEILADSTGNRRWLPVTVRAADVEGVVRDRDQLWAEAVVLFEREGVCWKDAESLAGAAHEQFRIEDSWEAPIRRWLHRKGDEMEGTTGVAHGDLPFSTEDVLTQVLGLGVTLHDRKVSLRVSSALRALGYESRSVRIVADNGRREVARRWVKRESGSETRSVT